MKVPLSNGSGSLSHSTAHQMRDVIPNRWWEPSPFRAGRKSVGRAYWQNERQASPLPGL